MFEIEFYYNENHYKTNVDCLEDKQAYDLFKNKLIQKTGKSFKQLNKEVTIINVRKI